MEGEKHTTIIGECSLTQGIHLAREKCATCIVYAGVRLGIILNYRFKVTPSSATSQDDLHGIFVELWRCCDIKESAGKPTHGDAQHYPENMVLASSLPADKDDYGPITYSGVVQDMTASSPGTNAAGRWFLITVARIAEIKV